MVDRGSLAFPASIWCRRPAGHRWSHRFSPRLFGQCRACGLARWQRSRYRGRHV